MSDSLEKSQSQASLSTSEISDAHSVSPLEPLDPHRLRDMVVDKQASVSNTFSSNWTSNISSPKSVATSHQADQTFPKASVELQQQTQFSFNQFKNYGGLSQQHSVSENRLIQPHDKQTSDTLSSIKSPVTIVTTHPLARLPTSHVITAHSNLSSPSVQSIMHTPQSPFPVPPRESSAASSTVSPSPFSVSQTPVSQPFLPATHNITKASSHYQIPSSPHQMISSGVLPSSQIYPSASSSIHHNSTSFQSSQISNHYQPLFNGVLGTQSSGQWVLQQQGHYNQQRIMGPPVQQRVTVPNTPPLGINQSTFNSASNFSQTVIPQQQQLSQTATTPKKVGRQQNQKILTQYPPTAQASSSAVNLQPQLNASLLQQQNQYIQQSQSLPVGYLSGVNLSPHAFMLQQQQQQQRFVAQQQQFAQMASQQQMQHQIATQHYYQQQQQLREQQLLLSGSGRTQSQSQRSNMAPPPYGIATMLPQHQNVVLPSNPNPIIAHSASFSQSQMQLARYSTPIGQIAAASSHLNSATPYPVSPGVGIGISTVAPCAFAPASSTGIVSNNLQSMRSPTLVSPISANQLPLTAQQQMLRPQELTLKHSSQSANLNAPVVVGRHLNARLGVHQVHHMHQSPPSIVVPVHQIRTANQFCGTELQGTLRYSSEICLAGCVFLIIDDYLPTQIDRNGLCAIIRFYGGDIETQSSRGIPDRVTHVICNTIAHNDIVIHQALNDRRKRIVTFQWLNEAIMKKRIEAPTKACHLPTCWNEHNRPAIGKIISIAGFDELETINLKSMIYAIGGKYNETLSNQTNVLIVKNANCEKIESVKQYDNYIHVLNYQWLVEIYFGNVRPLSDLENMSYSPLSLLPHFETSLSTYTLERISDFCQKLLYSWKLPIPLNEEIIDKAIELKKNIENDNSILPYRQFKCEENTPSEKQISEALKILQSSKKMPNNIFVHFENLLPEQIDHLSRKLRFLGGEVRNSVAECTHFVTPSLERTAKLIEAIARGKNVVSPNWIIQSFSMLKLVDAFDFFVYDPDAERQYSFNLKNTILRSKYRKVFEDVKFHLSPSVEPSFEILNHLITAAGGTVDRERPKRKYLAQCIQNDDTYLVIVNKTDLHLYNYLLACNFSLFTEECVLMAILRHEIDTSSSPLFFHQVPSLLQVFKILQTTTTTNDTNSIQRSNSISKASVNQQTLQNTSVPLRSERFVKAS